MHKLFQQRRINRWPITTKWDRLYENYIAVKSRGTYENRLLRQLITIKHASERYVSSPTS